MTIGGDKDDIEEGPESYLRVGLYIGIGEIDQH